MEYTEAFNDLSSVLSSLDRDQIQKFLTEILTEGELKDITLRWIILNDLSRVVPQRKISEDYHTSLCKITRQSATLKNKNGIIRKILRSRYDESSR